MLADSNVHATIPVHDMDEARKFYHDLLGLERVDEDLAGVLYQSGGCLILVYKSDFAGTNKGTAACWEVKDLEKTVEACKAKGIKFEHYDNLTGVTRQGDIHNMGESVAAWFKDPSGNILCMGSTL